MGSKYMVLYAQYPFDGAWDGDEGFDTFDETIEFVRDLQKQGFNIIDIQCRDIKEKK